MDSEALARLGAKVAELDQVNALAAKLEKQQLAGNVRELSRSRSEGTFTAETGW